MKKITTLLLICFGFFLFSMSLTAQENNTAPGSSNSFEKYLGKTIESNMKGPLDALVYIDYEIEDGKVLDALTALGYTATVATDWNDFSTKLGANNYGLAVAFNQNYAWSVKATVLSALDTYITNGGSVVFGDWTTDNDFAALFEAQFTGVNNQTEMTLDPSIASGLPNPISLVSTGWGTFSTGLTALGGGEVLATFPNGNASIVRGNGGKTVILGYLSDTPPEAYRQQLFMNLFEGVAPQPSVVPVSNWAIVIGLLLIGAFIVVRYRRSIIA